MADEIPPGLLKRWEEFGEKSRSCWLEAKAKGGPAAEEFPRFWDCMKKMDPVVSKAEREACARIGHPLAPHPICVLSNVSKGLSSADAVKMCIDEGRIHGISLIACRAAKEGAL